MKGSEVQEDIVEESISFKDQDDSEKSLSLKEQIKLAAAKTAEKNNE